MIIPASRLLGGLSPTHFLRDYWQKQPLLIRGALPDFRDPFSAEELAGLACEEGVEARLVLERDGTHPWELRHSPFTDQDFLTLPETHWTLLVQDAEKHAPDLAAIIEPFRFIPDWRIDDLMISYAAPQGSVGPHVDEYDVFLLQGGGRRRWQISTRAVGADNVLPAAELRILRDFTPEQEWILEPGDILYLPPRVAHHGVALEPCLSYSIGFRAPSHRELLSGFLDFLVDNIDPDARYTDPDLHLQDNPGALTAVTLTKVKGLLRQYLNVEDGVLESWFGRYATEPKPPFGAEPELGPLNEAELKAHLGGGGTLERNPGSRFAYTEQGKDVVLFVDGQEFLLDPSVAFLAPLLCQHRVLTPSLLRGALKQAPARALLLDLLNEGYLVIYEND